MSASTVSREGYRKPGEIVPYLMGAVKINKGTLVSVRVADGYLYPARSGTATDQFVGIAYEAIDNSAGSAGGAQLKVYKTGSFEFAIASGAQTMVGGAVYASDDQTLTTTSTNNQLVGYVQGISGGVTGDLLNSSSARVRIDRAVQ